MAEAEAMYRRALEGYEKAWGPEHPSTLDTVNNLGLFYANQGKMAEAEAMYRRALEGYEKAWGPEHPSTMVTVDNLGRLYAGQGKMAEAEAMFRRMPYTVFHPSEDGIVHVRAQEQFGKKAITGDLDTSVITAQAHKR
ncbi:beta transducin-like protein het-e4s [Lasallia pustulata]|uniref:Beta transducin-like protein het-e4s n=1 Tax=Lasallia pustulata TaxID=136370 RepID=A0A1W5CVI5_9LECA|nr:beta transducin-like protein het-e4s [Lasallia pustulata]